MSPNPISTASNAEPDSDEEDIFHDARFPPEEEATLLNESSALRTEANTHYARSDFSSALSTYDRALASCPNYLDYEVAVLKSNIAVCHLKLKEWKNAVEAATQGLEALEREFGFGSGIQGDGGRETVESGKGVDGDDGKVVELEFDEEDGVGDPKEQEREALKKLEERDARRRNGERIQAKCLMRRARGRMELGSWGELTAAEEDYKLLSQPPLSTHLPPAELKAVRAELISLPKRINESKEKEVAEMMGKLKELGNGILKPFGLSTDMFKMEQGSDGGYSMSFDGGGGKKTG